LSINQLGKIAGLIALSASVIAFAEASEVLPSYDVPKDFAMGIKHKSYDFSSIEKSKAELAMDYTQIKLPLGKYDFASSFFCSYLKCGKDSLPF
jgi:hypothetical protein